MRKSSQKLNILLLADGFEGIVQRVVNFIRSNSKEQIYNFDALLVSNRRENEEVGIPDLEAEISAISGFDKILIIRKENWLKHIYQFSKKLKERNYQKVVISLFGDKQFFILLMLLLICPLC